MHVHTVGTEQSLVEVTHVKGENRDQYLKGELEMYYTQWSQEATRLAHIHKTKQALRP